MNTSVTIFIPHEKLHFEEGFENVSKITVQYHHFDFVYVIICFLDGSCKSFFHFPTILHSPPPE